MPYGHRAASVHFCWLFWTNFFGPIRLVWFGLNWFEDVRWSFLGVWLSFFHTHLFSLPSTLFQVSLSYFEIVSMDKSNWILVNWMLLGIETRFKQDSRLLHNWSGISFADMLLTSSWHHRFLKSYFSMCFGKFNIRRMSHSKIDDIIVMSPLAK